MYIVVVHRSPDLVINSEGGGQSTVFEHPDGGQHCLVVTQRVVVKFEGVQVGKHRIRSLHLLEVQYNTYSL